MDHDLDSLLNSHLSSDDDDDDNGNLKPFHRRTVDEILNDSDSSASPPPSPPSDRRFRSFSSEESQAEPGTGSLARFKFGEALPASSPEDVLRRSSKPLPSLFGGVRSSNKPGAALAAAAAASRSVPSPHAAAIKSRRISLGSEGSGKVLDGGESLGSDLNGDLSAKSVEESNEDEKVLAGESLERDETVESSLETEHKAEDLLEVSIEQPQIDSVPLNYDTNVDFDENSDSEDRNGMFDRENSEILDVGDDREHDSSNLDSNRNGEVSEHSSTAESERGVSLSEEDGVGDNVSSVGDINELVEERIGQLESKMASERAEKKSQPRLKPLELAEELEKKHASRGLHLEEGATAQPMRLEGVRRGSIALGYFDVDSNNTITRIISSQAFRRDNGSPQVLAVHVNYIAVGMARGVIVVVPSKYSAHNADEMDGKMIMLGLQGDRYASVTSLCFNQLGDLLLAGYGDGHITVWDVQRSSAAKVITGEHAAPVVHALFLGQDSQVTRQFKAITGDTKGLVLLHAFSVVPLLNRFSNKTQCLLDGQRTGTTLSASPLLIDEFPVGTSVPSTGSATGSTSGISSMMGGVVGGVFNEGSSLVEAGVVIFVTYQTALVVRLSPSLEVYAQLSRPEGVREGSMPYTAWKCTTQSQKSTTENMSSETSERVSLLAIAWDRKVQVAKLVKSELKVYSRWSLDSAAIGVTWLDDQMLVVLTVSGQLYLCGNDGTVIHQTSFSVDRTPGNDLVTYHTYFNNIFGNPEKAYHNCLAARGACIYILGQSHFIVCRLLPWKERIQALRIGGDWMGSLNMAMTIYDGQAHGVVDLPRTLDAVQEAVMPYLVELLLAYVEEVFSYISVAFCNQIEKMDQAEESSSKSSSVHHEIKEQYTRVGGVAVEFCVHIKRTDILFDEIYAKFLAVKQKDTFLELLEPYIFRDMLGSLPPEIMQELVEHYSSKGWLQRVEQCVLHMDISSLDFNQVVRLCQEHGLYGALIYLFNKGLNDFRTPLEELLAVLHKSEREAAAALGYRILVYLKYCFSGLAFPPGHGKLPPSHLPTLREELLHFLLENSATVNSKVDSSISSKVANLNLYPLLQLDTEATLDVLRCAVSETEVPRPDLSSQNSVDSSVEVQEESISKALSPNKLVQNVVDVLINILDKDISQSDGSAISDGELPVIDWPSTKEIGYLFDFIGHYVACGRAHVSKRVLSQMMEYLTSENFALSDSEQGVVLKTREKQVLAVLKVVPKFDWDASYVLQLCEKAHFYQVSGMIHKARHQYLAALDTYMKDVYEPIHAFSFIDGALLELSGNDRTTFQSAVLDRIPELVVLNREGTFFTVLNLFNNEVSNVLSELRAHPKSLFLYLKTAVEVHLSGNLNFGNLLSEGKTSMKDKSEELEAYMEKISDFPKFFRNNPLSLTDEMVELYLELLCQYEPGSVLRFLETFDSYRVEHCLRLCQEHGIVDAASFLLERVGDVGSALLLTLSSLNNKFTKLADVIRCGAAGIVHFRNAKNLDEVREIESILNACIGLCQRNTPRLNPEESETLWFKLLDSFCEPLMGSFGDERPSGGENSNGALAEILGQRDDEKSKTKSRVPRPHKVTHVRRKLFSQFIKEIVEGMIGYVRLPTIMSKLLADNCGQEFGDFKLTILGMLGTYGFERRILDTAKSLIEDDTYYTMSLLKKGVSHGYAPRSQACCICNGLLTKSLSSSSIRVFQCGHATHLQCEALENGASGLGSTSGCPVCMPNNKRTQRSKNKSVLVENGLVKKVSSRPHQAQGVAVFPHDIDSLEYGYGIQQMSRFEMLNMLQKEQSFVQVENIPQLRLAPPAVYHEKVKKGTDLMTEESSSDTGRTEKQHRNKQIKDVRIKGSSLRFPLKSSIFGKEKLSKR